MSINSVKIDLAGNEEDHHAHGIAAGIATPLTFNHLEQAIEDFREAIGLPGLSPNHDAIKIVTDHSGDLLHRLDLGTHHVSTPLLCKQDGHNIDLFADGDFAQLFLIQPGTDSTLVRDVPSEMKHYTLEIVKEA